MAETQSATQIREDVICVRCNNPSPLTGPGTNTFLIGRSEIAVVDPGPKDAAHLDAILGAVPARAQITKILVTHSHLDHSPNATVLADQTGAPVYAFGADGTGMSEAMQALRPSTDLGGGEGRDQGFRPDHTLNDGDMLAHDGQELRAIWTPGHYGNHMAFQWGDLAFTGDLVMGWATTLVSPPDGDVSDFLASCQKLQDLDLKTLFPAHGAPILEPNARLKELIDHRRSRERQVLHALADGPSSPAALTERIYAEVAPHLWPAAARNVLAHLIDLHARGKVSTQGNLSPDAEFALS